MLPVVRNGGQIRGGWSRFFVRRAWRILPSYYVTIVLSLILGTTLLSQRTGTIWDSSLPFHWPQIFSHVLLIQDAFNDHKDRINYVLWSVGIEWRIYFVFPLLLWLWKKCGGFYSALGSIVFSLVVRKLLTQLHLPHLSVQFIALFAFGMLGATLCFNDSPHINRWRERCPWGILLLVLSLFIAPRVGMLNRRLPEFFHDIGIGIWAALLIIYLAQHPSSFARKWMESPLLLKIGAFSYSLYLTHPLILQLLWQYVIRKASNDPSTLFLILLAVAPVVCIAGSYLFFLFIERPFLRYKPYSQRIKQPLESLVK